MTMPSLSQAASAPAFATQSPSNTDRAKAINCLVTCGVDNAAAKRLLGLYGFAEVGCLNDRQQDIFFELLAVASDPVALAQKVQGILANSLSDPTGQGAVYDGLDTTDFIGCCREMGLGDDFARRQLDMHADALDQRLLTEGERQRLALMVQEYLPLAHRHGARSAAAQKAATSIATEWKIKGPA